MDTELYTIVACGESTTVIDIELREDELPAIIKVFDRINAQQGDAYEPSVWLWRDRPPATDQVASDEDMLPVNVNYYQRRAWRRHEGQTWMFDIRFDGQGNRTETPMWVAEGPKPEVEVDDAHS